MNPAADYGYIFKLLVVGDDGVGKSSLILRYADDTFAEDMTFVGFDLKTPVVDVDGATVRLQIWDVRRGSEKFRRVTPSYYRGVDGLLVIYDITNAESFNNVTRWLDDINKHAKKNVNKVLVGNKSDLDSKRVVSFEQAQEFAKSMGMEFVETSAENSTNVDKAFLILTTQITERVKSQPLFDENSGANIAPATK